METPITLPFVFWNKNSTDPEHKISCLALTSNTLVTGSFSGELCIWKYYEKSFAPRIICTIGRTFQCLALSFVIGPIPELVGSSSLIASLHSDNKIRVWDIEDGRCTNASSSSLLPPCKFFNLLTCQGQFLAVSGQFSEIFLIDVWSMQKIASFSMTASVVGMICIENNIWAVDSKGSLREFYLPETSDFFFDPMRKLQISSVACTVYNINEEVEGLLGSDSGEVIVVKIKHGLRVYLRQWLQEQRNEYAHVENPLITSVFCADKILIVMSDKVLGVDINKVVGLMTASKKQVFSRSSSLSSMQVHTLEDIMESKIIAIDKAVELVSYRKKSLIGYKDNVVVKFKHSQCKRFVFSFRPISFEYFADMCVNHVLSPSETITCSMTYLTSDWPLYIIGTSTGKIYVCPFHPYQAIQFYHYHSAPITCLFIKSDKMISCCKNHMMCLWHLELRSLDQMPDELLNRDKAKRRSVQVTHHSGSTKKKELQSYKPLKCIEFFFGSILRIIRVEGIKEERPFESTDLLIGQGKDYSIILVSLELGQILGYFPPISSNASEAYLQKPLDYLMVLTECNTLYIFNTASNSLERILDGVEIFSIIRKPPRLRIHSETFDEVVEETSAKQRITLFNLRQLFPTTAAAALKVSSITIGNTRVPLLVLNVLQIIKKLSKAQSPSAQLEYILSLLTCWTNYCKAHDSLSESVKDILKLNNPQIRANIGTIGVEDAMSFTLPSSLSSFEVSPYVASLVMSSGYALVESLAKFTPASKKKNSRVVTAHLLSQVHDMDSFKIPFLSILAVQSFSGLITSGYILQDNISFLDLKSKQKFLDTLSTFIEEQWVIWDKYHKKEVNRSYVGLMEALCVTLLGSAAIEFQMVKKEVVPLLIKSLRCMLRTENEGYLISAANILGKGMPFWRTDITAEEIKEIVKELLFYGCKESQAFRPVFYKAIMHIAMCDFLHFLEILAREIENIEIGPNYPSACISVLELFIIKKYEEVVAFLPGVIELIVRTLNPHNPILRKNAIEKAGHTLKTLILKLPMIAFCQVKQKLVIGTVDHLVVLYDLKTASQWKILKGHTGAISAVEFNKAGDHVASYSIEDSTVKVWKLKTGFLQDLIGTNSLKPTKSFSFEPLGISSEKQKKVLDTVNLSWAHDDRIFLTREDGNRNVIQL